MAYQLLQHLHLAAPPDELSGEGFAADVVVDARLDAELLADGRELPVGVFVGVVVEAGQAFLILSLPQVAQGLARERQHGFGQGLAIGLLGLENHFPVFNGRVLDVLQIAQPQRGKTVKEEPGHHAPLHGAGRAHPVVGLQRLQLGRAQRPPLAGLLPVFEFGIRVFEFQPVFFGQD